MTDTTLDDYRRRIDAIDDQLIALMKERIGVVEQVGAYKQAQGETGVFIRPGREGAMHRRIVDAFRDSGFHPQAALHMWRLLISASTHRESPLRLAVWQQSDAAELVWLAREYFGSFVSAQPYSNPLHIIADVHERKAGIGILPYPQDEANWWHALAQYQQPRVYIFARLPLLAGQPSQQAALALAEVTPEPSGNGQGEGADDESYFAITLEDTVSTSKLHGLFQQSGLEPVFLNTASQPPLRSLLVRLDGFYNDAHPALQQLAVALEGIRIRFLGAHPKAIAL